MMPRVHASPGHALRPGETFEEMLVDSLRKTPWLVLSLAFHLALLVALSGLEFRNGAVHASGSTEVVLQPPQDDPIEPIPVPVKETDFEPDVTDPPTLEDVAEPDVAQEDGEPDLDDDPSDDLAFEEIHGNAVLGLGSGASGGAFRGRLRRDNEDPTGHRNRAVNWGLSWLARHQAEDGSWDCDGYPYACESGTVCEGTGHPAHDVGVTALALLAFLGAGETNMHGEYRETVRRGLRWLRSVQDPEGCFGGRVFDNFTYGHAIATLAMAEAYGMTSSPILREPAQKGIDFVAACRNPGRAWRYGVRTGENDISVTGWMVMALKSARMAGLRVDPRALMGARDFVEAMTDESGRVGYLSPGSLPVRPEGREMEFPARASESLTAVGIVSRIFVDEDPETSEAIRKGARLCLAKLPDWDPPKLDFYYWYYGTLALFQVGGAEWRTWNRAMERAIVHRQRRDEGCVHGSWDPVDAWGGEGGRVYSTALLTMCLEVYYRYPRVFGATR